MTPARGVTVHAFRTACSLVRNLAATGALVLMIGGCGTQQRAAELALAGVQVAYGGIRTQATNIAPGQARSIETAIAGAEASLAGRDVEATMQAVRELHARVADLTARLPAMQSELETTWGDLEASLPPTLTALDRKLSRMNRPANGSERTTFDAARHDLSDMTARWREARATMQDGSLAGAVTQAEGVRERATRLLDGIQSGS